MQYLKNFSKFVFEHCLKIVLGLLSNVAIINYLGPTEFGWLAIILTVYQVSAVACALGLDAILFKRFLEEPSLLLLKNSIILRLISAGVFTILSILMLFFLESTISFMLIALAATFWLDSVNAVREFLFAKKSYNVVIIAGILGSSFQLVSTIYLIHINADYSWFVVPIISNRLISALFLIITQWNTLNSSLSKKGALDIKLLKSSFPMMIAAFGGLVYAIQDQWMIKVFLDSSSVGIYVAGIKLVTIAIVLPNLITNLLYNKIVNLNKKSSFESYVTGIYSSLFYFGLIIYLFIYLFSETATSLIFTSAFADSQEVLEVYSIILVLAFFHSLNNKILILEGKQKLIMRRVFYSIILNFLLNYYLINTHGLIGAAYATVLSEFFILMSYYLNNETRQIFLYQISGLNFFNINNIISLNKTKRIKNEN